LKTLLLLFLSTFILAENKINMHGGNYDELGKRKSFSNTISSPFVQKKKILKIDEIKIEEIKIEKQKEKKNGK